METRIEISDTPPSLNVTGASRSWWIFAKHKRLWESMIWTLLMAEGKREMSSPVSVRAQLRFPSKRRRDEGNYRVILEKSAGDALVKGGFIPDDTPDHYRFFGVIFEEKAGPHRTILEFVEGQDE